MRVNYFDLGLYKGGEIGLMADVVLPALGITDYEVHGFEACLESYEGVVDRYEGKDSISIHNLAVGDKNEMKRLYYCVDEEEFHPIGNSLFASKRNVGEDFEEVQCVVLSDWLNENVPEWRDCINILRMNIEGAEWHVMSDLRDKGLLGHFKLYCGSKPGHDLKKVGEMEQYYDDFNKLLEDNDIEWKIFHNEGHTTDIIDYLRSVI